MVRWALITPMRTKILLTSVILSVVFFWASSGYCVLPQPQSEPNPLIQFINNIEYSSRLKFEYDDNIFLTEDNRDSDFRQIFSQAITYKSTKDKSYFQLGYNGNYSYYDQEALGVLGHTANMLYSYRPFDGFSIGIRNDFNWLADSKIATTLGDRTLALGYTQNVPSIQVKYEISPQYSFVTDAYYQFLDVRNSENDDYIDNRRVGVKGQLNYNFTPQRNFVGFLGFEHKQITFPQVSEKASVSERPFVGLTEKAIGIFNFTQEVGFENINMTDSANADDRNVDWKFSWETVFSIYTKLRLSFDYNTRNASLRRQYTQYGSNLATLSLTHAINPKTYLLFDYSYERQEFNSADVLAGQTNQDNNTFIQNIGLTVSRKLQNWLTLDWRYDYTKRDSDFAQEGYTDNRYSVALTAKY